MKTKYASFFKHAGKVMAALAIMVVTYNVNTCCALYAYQPKLPENAERFKKI